MGSRTDADIQRDVIESLYWDTRVDAADVGVLVDDGHVTLVGTVPTYRARAAASEDALVIRDVTDVDNRLAVAISPELDTPDDDQLRAAVLDVLIADPDLAAANIEVEVQAGTVRLRGAVPTFWERELARSITVTLPGVRGLANELVVVPTGDHDDEEIARQVAASLARNRHVDLDAVDISVTDGRVVLDGHVPDHAVHDQVLDAARYTPGVTDIENRLWIDGS